MTGTFVYEESVELIVNYVDDCLTDVTMNLPTISNMETSVLRDVSEGNDLD